MDTAYPLVLFMMKGYLEQILNKLTVYIKSLWHIDCRLTKELEVMGQTRLNLVFAACL